MARKVFFVGNPIAGNDAIASYLYRALALPDSHFLGTNSVDLVSMVGDEDEIIIVDALLSEKNIGEIKEIRLDELQISRPISPHDFGIEQSLKLLELFKPKVKIRILGVCIDNQMAAGFSPDVKNKLPQIVERLKECMN